LGYSVVRYESAFLAENLKEFDLLLVLDPLIPPGEGERIEVETWVRQGGTLICNSRVAKRFLAPASSTSEPGELEWESEEESKKQNVATPVPPKASGLVLAADVNETRFSTTKTLDTSSLLARDSSLKSSRQTMKKWFADSYGLRIAAFPLSAGRLVVYSDSSFLSNGLIGLNDNAILAVNLIAQALGNAKGRRVAFDENHFDSDRRETGWPVLTGLLFKTSPGWAVLCLTAAGILFLMYKGRRFGARHPILRVRRRSKLEFVHSVAATYQSAGANRLMFKLIYRSFKHQAARTVGLPESAPAGDIASELAKRAGKPRETYQSIFQNCEKAANAATGKLSARQISPLLDQLKTIELEAIDGTAARQ